VAVAAHDDKIGVVISSVREQRVGDVEIAVVDALDVHVKSVTRKVLTHINAFDLVLFVAFVGDDDDNLDESRPLKERHGISNRARRRPATVPAHHDAVELEGRFLDVGHDDGWPARVEQGGFDDLIFNRGRLGFGLPDNGEIEVASNAAELVADAGEIGAGA